ncbi:MAG: hypothetical protein V3U65_06255 [Granulosicoccaceae bacterium]
MLWCGSSIFNTVTEPPQDLAGMALVNREGYLNAESGIKISETVTFYEDNQFMIESYPLDQGFECTELPCTSPSVVIGYTLFSGTYNQNEDVIRFEGIDSTTGSNVTKVYVIRQSKAKPTTFEVSMSGVCRSEFIKDGY